jgi:hypothetical protein
MCGLVILPIAFKRTYRRTVPVSVAVHLSRTLHSTGSILSAIRSEMFLMDGLAWSAQGSATSCEMNPLRDRRYTVIIDDEQHIPARRSDVGIRGHGHPHDFVRLRKDRKIDQALVSIE